VTELRDPRQTLELPQITAGPGDHLLICWSQGTTGAGDSAVWCSTRPEDGPWRAARPVLEDPAGRVRYGYPSVAATDDAFWLYAYASDTTLDAELHRSADGEGFGRTVRLASASLAGGRFCPRPGLPCRTSASDFFPGDYVSLAGSPKRVVAAYAIPRRGGAAGSRTMMVSVVDP